MGESKHAAVMGIAAGALLLGSAGAWAQDDKARAWAASCASCHGTNGRSAGEVPSLAGKSKADLLATLQEFRAGKRKTATIMHQYTKGYNDAQLERIAEYFSQQAR